MTSTAEFANSSILIHSDLQTSSYQDLTSPYVTKKTREHSVEY